MHLLFRFSSFKKYIPFFAKSIEMYPRYVSFFILVTRWLVLSKITMCSFTFSKIELFLLLLLLRLTASSPVCYFYSEKLLSNRNYYKQKTKNTVFFKKNLCAPYFLFFISTKKINITHRVQIKLQPKHNSLLKHTHTQKKSVPLKTISENTNQNTHTHTND